MPVNVTTSIKLRRAPQRFLGAFKPTASILTIDPGAGLDEQLAAQECDDEANVPQSCNTLISNSGWQQTAVVDIEFSAWKQQLLDELLMRPQWLD
uniref:Uncharacterized protein n=1 Tax=Angiostrongylus cantonensis TaxID=6313 RepID=A0A0K0CWX8_ANGCA